MASIAYVTDQNMIEFHRLNGNTKMNFWRPSASKKFADFKSGDFLFFLAKGTQRGMKKEKGIIGYGKFTKANMLSFNQMWKRYETLNGYGSKDDLYEAIVKVTKDKVMPKQLHCLELDEVVFFQAPIYLSELGMEISNNIESYIYLDKEDMLITNKILAQAQMLGVDAWTQLFQDTEKVYFRDDALMSAITNINEKINQTIYTEYEDKRILRFVNQIMNLNKNCILIPNNRSDFIEWVNDEVILYIPCITNFTDFRLKIQYIIGHYMMYCSYLNQLEDSERNRIKILLMLNNDPDKEIRILLESLNIEYAIKKEH